MERATVLFTPEGKATFGLIRLWKTKGAAQPLHVNAVLIEQDRSATRFLRGLWGKAFPTRDPLPFGPLADERGIGTVTFWDIFE